MISTRLEGWTWRSHAVLAAELAPDGTIRRANLALERHAGRKLVGEPARGLVAAPQGAALDRRIADAGDEWRSGTFAVLGDPARPASDRTVWLHRAGDVVLLVAEPAVDEQELLVAKALELNDELVRANRRLGVARAESEASADRLRRLEAVTAAGLSGLELDVVLRDLLHVIREALHADQALVLLGDESSRELEVRATSAGEGPVVLERGFRVAFGTGVAGRIAEDGLPRLVRDLAAETDVPAAVRGGARSLAGVPLHAAGAVIGVLEVVATEAGAFDEADLRLLLPAAERAALAIARLQVVEQERRIAETLQRALLPDRLPKVPGYLLVSHFEPAAGEIGGDWYDALPLEGGEVALVIGDVAGKGVPAAALMGELRSGLRAYALDGGPPDEVLRRLDRLAVRTGHMATASLVLLDPATGALRHATAGHLPALLLEPGAGGRFLRDGAFPPLLALRGAAGVAGRTVLPPGGRLVLYTDGLVERRDEAIDTSLEHLRAAAEAHTGPVEGLAEHLIARLHPPKGALRDDIAVLVLERAAP
jgi:phosphoserine phosphatase RsbU/P